VEEQIQNNGNWNITDFKFVIGAAHTPDFDDLMIALRRAERAVAEDEPRVRKLPRPWLGDPWSHQLKRTMHEARARAMAYALAHKDIIIIEGR
jgi:hypothetical protein